jgi:hypothetical protein
VRKHRGDVRGQFAIVAALLISLLTLSVAISVHEMNLHRQQVKHNPVDELVLGITSDLERATTYALSKYTREYNDTGSEINATSQGCEFVSKWVGSVHSSYSNLGLKINMRVDPAEGKTDVSFRTGWGIGNASSSKIVGFSQVAADFDLDVDAYGFKGWKGESRKLVMLTIFPNDDDSDLFSRGAMKLKFRIVQGSDPALPIPNLTNESLEIRPYVNYVPLVSSTINRLEYLGDGNYTVTFSPVDWHTDMVKLAVITPEDHIIVSAYFERNQVFVGLRSREKNGPTQNLGSIQLGNYLFEQLPVNSWQVPSGEYVLNYTPPDPDYSNAVYYKFLNWTTEGPITVSNPNSSLTKATIIGNGNITAFYERYIPESPKKFTLTLRSRNEDNSPPPNLGNITLTRPLYSTTYTLPNSASGLDQGDYPLLYTPRNASYYFVKWEWLGGCSIFSGTSSATTVTVFGDGTVTAVYSTKPPKYSSVTVTLQSQEISSPSPTNKGQIQFAGGIFSLPATTTVAQGMYTIRYLPENGYTFLYWTTTSKITVLDATSSTTTVTVSGDGTITAFYRGCNVFLESREWNGATLNQGVILFGSTNYALSANVTGLAKGDYPLQYTPDLGYVFMWWESTGDVAPLNGTSNATTLAVFGDGNVTAIYGASSPPPEGSWNTLYFAKGFWILPPPIDDHSSHESSRASTGTGKAIAILNSTETPLLNLSSFVKITAYLGIDPPSNAKDVTMELGYTYDGHYYKLGSGTFTINSEGIYRLVIDTTTGEFPSGYIGAIPEGSIISLDITVTFIKQPWGTLKIFYGPNNPSCIELY